MWEVVFPNIPIKGGIVHPDVHSLFDGPGQAVFFSANDFKVSIDVSWPLLLWCTHIGDGAFKCSLNLSSKVLPDSPMYSSLQLIFLQL